LWIWKWFGNINILTGKSWNSQHIFEKKVFNFISHQGKENQNHNEILSHFN
jgi:hypothetical protein